MVGHMGGRFIPVKHSWYVYGFIDRFVEYVTNMLDSVVGNHMTHFA